jgi:NAD+ kinase
MNRIGIIFHPRRKEAAKYSRKLATILEKKSIKTWQGSAWEPGKFKKLVKGTDLVFCIGGDGTILRAAKAIIPWSVPITGINMGNLGFMSELTQEEVSGKLPRILKGEGWIEKRAILEVRYKKQKLYALNDVFIGRRSLARLITLECKINGEPLTRYRADGIIVSTASGSTGYNMAAGGPVLHPQSKEIILQPVSSHLSFSQSLVLPPETGIELKVTTTHEAMLSVDGQIEEQLNSGDTIEVQLSKYTARFLRLKNKDYFYKSLEHKLIRKSI